MPRDMMTNCEEKRLYKVEGKKVWRWIEVAVANITAEGANQVRCAQCHGDVKLRKLKGEPHGHIEHRSRIDSENCRGGHHFLGDHRLSSSPVV